MKKELSPVVIIGIIAGVAAALIAVVYFMIRSDPATQGPHAPPRFDPATREAAERQNPPPTTAGQAANAPPPGPPGAHPTSGRPTEDMRGGIKPQVN